MLKDIFTLVGIYTTIATIWRFYELVQYGQITPKEQDTRNAILLTIVIYTAMVRG